MAPCKRYDQGEQREHEPKPAAGETLLTHLERYFSRHKTAQSCQRPAPDEAGRPSKISA